MIPSPSKPLLADPVGYGGPPHGGPPTGGYDNRGPPGGYDQGGYRRGEKRGYAPEAAPPGTGGGPGGPPPMYGGDAQRQGGYGGGYNNGRSSGGYGGPEGGYGGGGQVGGMGDHQTRGGMMGPPGTMGGAVVMVYGMNMEKMNADKLFNLLCLYGNVNKVKFLKTKEGSAMVEMGNHMGVENAVNNLNNIIFMESKMTLGFSKQECLQPVANPYELPDGTPSYKEYLTSRYNRFSTPESASKNRIQPPSKVLHYYNTPPNMPEEEMMKIFTENKVRPPSKMKQFPSKSDRSSTGLIEWDESSEALEALVVCNHHPIENAQPGRPPYTFKICFSNSPIQER